MKRVGGNKEHLIWAENNEFYYDEDEVLSSLESHCILPIAEWYWDFLKKIFYSFMLFLEPEERDSACKLYLKTR